MKRLSSSVAVLLCLALCASCAAGLAGCAGSGAGARPESYSANPALDVSREVELRIGSGKETWPEMDEVIAKFEEVYPNCSISCEYIEEYSTNLELRLKQADQRIDIFRTTNIQPTTSAGVYKDYCVNLISEESAAILDLSHCYKGLVDNFRYTGAENTQYAVPYGGEMRGMYVNTTLLDSLGLKTPTNRAELLECCAVLYDAGYIPLQSSYDTFAQQLLYPYICNCIVNGGAYEETYAAIENIDAGISELFRDPYTFLYGLVEKGYFDYDRVKRELGYTFDGSEGKARDFLNVIQVADGVYEKQDDVGKIAFLVDTQSFEGSLAKEKENYHSAIEYEFILSPVGEDGGCAYLSPSDALAVNKSSNNVDWALEFLNFFFQPEVTREFAAWSNKIPNTADALLSYNVDESHISDVGQVTFGYTFYKTVTTPMMGGYEDMPGISKLNDPKLMVENADGTRSLAYTVEDYLERLESELQAVKAGR